MNDTKNPLQSLGIMGPLVSLIVLAVNWKWPGLGMDEATAGSLINQIASVVGLLTGMYGRMRATTQVKVGG